MAHLAEKLLGGELLSRPEVPPDRFPAGDRQSCRACEIGRACVQRPAERQEVVFSLHLGADAQQRARRDVGGHRPHGRPGRLPSGGRLVRSRLGLQDAEHPCDHDHNGEGHGDLGLEGVGNLRDPFRRRERRSPVGGVDSRSLMRRSRSRDSRRRRLCRPRSRRPRMAVVRAATRRYLGQRVEQHREGDHESESDEAVDPVTNVVCLPSRTPRDQAFPASRAPSTVPPRAPAAAP